MILHIAQEKEGTHKGKKKCLVIILYYDCLTLKNLIPVVWMLYILVGYLKFSLNIFHHFPTFFPKP